MGCEKRTQLRDLLFGNLGKAETLAALDHTRECDECKHQLTEHARMHAASNATESEGQVETKDDSACGAVDHSVRRRPTYQPSVDMSASSPQPRFRSGSWKRMMLVGVICAALFGTRNLFEPKSDATGGTYPNLTHEAWSTALALEEGRPWLGSPRGNLKTRPKVIRAVIPAGNHHFELTILHQGTPLWERTCRDDDPGATFDVIKLPSTDGGSIPALEVLIPFPAVTLKPENRYFFFITLPNDVESAPSHFAVE